jgi:hypothetical protein
LRGQDTRHAPAVFEHPTYGSSNGTRGVGDRVRKFVVGRTFWFLSVSSTIRLVRRTRLQRSPAVGAKQAACNTGLQRPRSFEPRPHIFCSIAFQRWLRWPLGMGLIGHTQRFDCRKLPYFMLNPRFEYSATAGESSRLRQSRKAFAK